MKLTFLGATHEVTGSCTMIEVCGKYGLVDCGMEQGKDIFENQDIPVNPAEIDFVLLTHAHIDHSGKLPLLYKNGFRGPIYATDATCSLCSIMLRDSAHIQEFEAEWRNRKAKRADAEPYVPLYDINDAEGAIQKLRPCPYGEVIRISEGVTIRFTDVGHLLGSSCIEIWAREDGVEKKLVFSGDVGSPHHPMIRDPQTVDEADFVVIESTYGDRLHDRAPDYVGFLADVIQRTLDRGGNVVIPSFAVGRTQELLYYIREIKQKGLVKHHDGFPVYVDSPLAIEATSIFLQCDPDIFDAETRAVLKQGVNPIYFQDLHTTVTSDESRMINFDSEPKVIISASGMCEAGRIRHHLKHNLWREDSTILFVGYQAVGTLGRAIYEGATSVKLFGEEVAVHAEITYIPGISGHADKQGLLNWLKGFQNRPTMVFVNHGDDTVTDSFARTITEQFGLRTYAPYSGTIYDFKEERFLAQPVGIPIKAPAKTPSANASAAMQRLLAAGDRLQAVLRRSEGMSNKDLARFTSQIEALCDKWQN